MSDFIMPNLQREKIEEYLGEGKRLDGRKSDEYRKLLVEDGVSKNAASAVRVRFGKTEVLAGVHLALATPYPDSPDSGTFMTSAELHPMASQQFDIGRPGINSIELARVIDRGIRESGFIDMKKLCIKEGEKVYQVFVDIFAINDDGNLLDVAGLAALIALGRARMPIYNEEEDKIDGYSEEEGIPLNKDVLSFSMTFHKVGDVIVADVGHDEEAISKFRLTIAMGDNNGKPRITAMQKGKAGTISNEDMENILKLAESKWTEMFPKIKKHVFG
ncbi:exosome complex protein Rrp42 [Candidatus Pacearchaeota archaeon]|nr:exosome complex protein Rrp42 [Candidatus Pacearchaeota archaeon]